MKLNSMTDSAKVQVEILEIRSYIIDTIIDLAT